MAKPNRNEPVMYRRMTLEDHARRPNPFPNLEAILANAENVTKTTADRDMRDAAELLISTIHELKTRLVPEAEGVLNFALLVGRLDEQLYARTFIPAVQKGRRAETRGQDRVHAIAAKRRERREEIKAHVADRIRHRGRHKTPSNTQIFRETAELFSVSIPTIRRACGKK